MGVVEGSTASVEVVEASAEGGSERCEDEEREEMEEGDGEEGKETELNRPEKNVERMSCWWIGCTRPTKHCSGRHASSSAVYPPRRSRKASLPSTSLPSKSMMTAGVGLSSKNDPLRSVGVDDGAAEGAAALVVCRWCSCCGDHEGEGAPELVVSNDMPPPVRKGSREGEGESGDREGLR